MEKMTNVKAIEYVIANCEIPTEVAEKLEKMKASFIKKSSGERKPTKTQAQNEALKPEILDYMEEDVLYSIGQLTKEVPALVRIGASSQKTSALVKQLKDTEGVTEQLKENNQMLWVQEMNNIQNRVTEIIKNKLIYK